MHKKSNLVLIIIITISFGGYSCENNTPTKTQFDIMETTIVKVHYAFKTGDLTARQLVQMYLDRIEAYDQSTKLNAIVVVNPNALKIADELDAEYKKTGKLRPLHGIPIIVKDNYDTYDLPTTGGSLAMKGSIAPDDAFQVAKIREAGAIVLGKSNMAEWAFSAYKTESSIAGITRNPYDLSRVPAGSSGGTAAAVAANLALAGLGTDTGNSIRGPSSHNNLVGIRSTMGATSRDGIIPLMLRNDIGGPFARTIEDAVRIYEVIAGYDPKDPITERSQGKIVDDYLQYLGPNSLRGARIGVLRRYIDTPTADPEIIKLTEKAIIDLKTAGAEIVDPFDISNYDALIDGIWCNVFQHDVNNYLASLGEDAPVKSLQDVKDSGLYLPYVEKMIEGSLKKIIPPAERDPICIDIYNSPKNTAFSQAVNDAMDTAGIDAFIYPTWSNPPRLVGDMESPAGDNSQYISPHTGMPAITVPTGFTENGLPSGITFIGRHFDEPIIMGYIYAYEQKTSHRKPPPGFARLSK
jgi:Asp-tRNA(Asn)/Glu-tRNA(Gln) amidotransferase A subunit family amidase